MKKYFLNVISLAILIFTISCASQTTDTKVTHFVRNPWDLSATINIPYFNDSLKMMQITDIHISIEDENEADLMKYAERMHKAYLNPRKHYSQDTSKTTFQYLDDILLKAKNEKIELLLLTGDIVNFPSPVSVKYVYDKLVETGIPWLYISGNHDWHYEGMPGSLDSLRLTWIEKSLSPLYNGHNPLFYSEIINGINFVGIDNSTYEVNENQVQFLKDQLSRNEPIILLSHIPYNLESAVDQPGMATFIETVLSNTDKIVAILAGHIHRTSFFFTGNLCQYTSIASFQGASFVVDVKSKQ